MSLFSKLKGTTDTQFSIGPAAAQGFFNGDLKIDSIIPATLLDINGDTAITGAANPAFDSYTSLMLHMDGTDTSQTFTDEIGHSMTAVNHAQIDTAYYKFSTASGLFDGTDDYLTGPIDSAFDFGTGDFTVDFWLRFNGIPGNQPSLFGGGNSYNNGLGITFATGVGGLYIYFNGTGNIQAWTAYTATWYHIAVVRSGTSVKTFVDGTQVGSTLTGVSDNLSTGQTFHIGGGVGSLNYFNGWIDEFRISKGVARWFADFTKPASPYAPSGVNHTLTVGSLEGIIKASSGTLGVAGMANGMNYNGADLGNSYLDQSVKIAAAPQFTDLTLKKSANPTLALALSGTPASGDTIGNIDFRDSANNTYAAISGICDGTPGANDRPGRIAFYTVKDGEDWLNLRLDIKQSGKVNIVSQGALGIIDSADVNYLRLKCAETLTAEKTLQLITGDTNRTLTLSGNPTIADWFDQAVKQASSPTFAAITNTQRRNSMASVYLNADQTPTEGAWVKVNMAHESFDIGSNYDVSNYRYVAPVTGYYQCDWGILCTSATNQIDIVSSALYVNAAYYRQGTQTRHVAGLQGSISSNGGCLAYVTSGQYIELYGYCSSADASAVKFVGVAASAIACYLTIHLIST